MGKRIAYIDLAKGICISIVMLFHIRGICANTMPLSPVMFSACMLPPFFLLSGVFFKEEVSYGIFLRKKVDRLLLPFLFFYLATAVVLPNVLHYIFGMRFETTTGWSSLWAFIWPGEYPNIPLWFLWCLFIVNNIFRLLLSLSKAINEKRHHIILILFCLSCAVVGISSEDHLQTDFANLFKALKNMPLFCFGYILSHFDTLSKIESMGTRRRLWVLFIAIAISLLSCLTYDNLWTNAVMYYVYGTGGAALVIILSLIIVQIPLISFLGRYSIIVLLTHGLMVRAGHTLFQHLSLFIPSYISVAAFWMCMVCSYFAIVPFCKKFLPHVTAQKSLFYQQLNHEESSPFH